MDRIYRTAITARLYAARRPLSTNQVAKSLGISWAAANKHLKAIYKQNQYIQKRTTRGRGKTTWKYG